MSEPARRALIASGLLLGFVLSLICGACDDDETRVERLPLQFELLEGPDTLAVGATDSLRVGAIVGDEGCTLEGAQIERRGDSLLVRGSARCEYHPAPYATFEAIAAPTVPNGQILIFALPDLEPGTYFTIAGAFTDTLVVIPAPHPGPHRRVVARGDIVLTSPLCPGPPLFFVSLPPLAPRFELVDLTPPGMPRTVVLRGIWLQPSACAAANGGVLRVRGWVLDDRARRRAAAAP